MFGVCDHDGVNCAALPLEDTLGNAPGWGGSSAVVSSECGGDVDWSLMKSYVAGSKAAAFVEEARQAAVSLADFADRGQIVPECDDESIREFLLKPYRLVYKITEEHVFIVALIHGAQRLWRF